MLRLLMGNAPVVVRSSFGFVHRTRVLRRLGLLAALGLVGCAGLNEPVDIAGGANAVTDAPGEAFEVTGSVELTVRGPDGTAREVDLDTIRSYRFGITRYIVREEPVGGASAAATSLRQWSAEWLAPAQSVASASVQPDSLNTPDGDDVCVMGLQGGFKCTLRDSSGTWEQYVLEGRFDATLADGEPVRCFASKRIDKEQKTDVVLECETMVAPVDPEHHSLAGQVFGMNSSNPASWAEVRVRQGLGTQSCLVQPFTGYLQCGTLPAGDYTVSVETVEPFTGCGGEFTVTLPMSENDGFFHVRCRYPHNVYLPIVSKN